MTILTTAAAALVSSAVGANAPAVQGHQAKAHKASRTSSGRFHAVLYDQTNDYGGYGMVSQDFGDDYDSSAADDFVVPKGVKWSIEEIEIPGFYFNGYGPADSETIRFWKSGSKGPIGSPFRNFTVVGKDKDGTFVIKIPGKGVKVRGGHFWMSVVANMPFVPGGEWAWENQTTGTTEGFPAEWMNLEDGYGTGCTSWTAETECVPSPQGDHLFTLKGRAR